MYRCNRDRCQGNSFSNLFAAAGAKKPSNGTEIENTLASSSVDCTLSLGTPSTRHNQRLTSSSSYMSKSNLCWDIFQTASSSPNKSDRGLLCLGTDSRTCANCDTASTPLWRNGPKGPKSLCNACGIRYKKEERRVTTKATATEAHHLISHHHHHQMAAPPTDNREFMFIEEGGDDGESSYPYLSWRLNVPPQDFPVHIT